MKNQVIYTNEHERRHVILPDGQGVYREIDSIIQQENDDGTIGFTFRTELFPCPQS